MNCLFVVTIFLGSPLTAFAKSANWDTIRRNDVEISVPFSLDSRIFGGTTASPGAFPFMVPLWVDMVSSQGIQFGSFCGATLISENFLLTAAHCLTGDPVGVRTYFGAHVISNDFEPGRVEMKIPKENLIIHEEYDWNLKSNDIALIRLPERINFTREIQPVKLPRADQIDLEDAVTVVTGWGAMGQRADNSKVLLYAKLWIRADDFCEGFYRKYYHSSNLCIDASRQSPCSGDSGGPAVIIEKDRSFTQVGVASYVSHYGCQVGYPVVYTRVTSYLDWIHKHTGISVRG